MKRYTDVSEVLPWVTGSIAYHALGVDESRRLATGQQCGVIRVITQPSEHDEGYGFDGYEFATMNAMQAYASRKYANQRLYVVEDMFGTLKHYLSEAPQNFGGNIDAYYLGLPGKSRLWQCRTFLEVNAAMLLKASDINTTLITGMGMSTETFDMWATWKGTNFPESDPWMLLQMVDKVWVECSAVDINYLRRIAI